MAGKITKKYAFGTYANDVAGVNLWVSKKEFDRMMRVLEHQFQLRDMIIHQENKISKFSEVRYDGDTYRETVTVYTCGTADFEFIVREAKDGYYFKSRR